MPILRLLQGIVLVYDVTDRQSFYALRDWMSQIAEVTTTRAPICAARD